MHQLPPKNLEAEESVLSAILINNSIIKDVLDILTPEDFYKSAHQKIFEAIVVINSRKRPVDLVTTSNYLRAHNRLEEVGGATCIARLIDNAPLAVNAAEYAQIVHEKAVKRRLIAASNEIAKKCYADDDSDVSSLLIESQAAITSVSYRDPSDDSFFTMEQLTETAIDRYEERSQNRGKPSGLLTGFHLLDHITGGFQPSDLIILAARPSMGKEQPLYSKILTPDGWGTMGEIKKGDLVIGSGGAPIMVLDTFDQGIKPIYRIHFSDDTFADCGLDHLWETESRQERKNGWGKSIKTTRKIIESGLYVNESRKNHGVSYCKPVQLSGEPLPIDPYVLGVYIGDGDSGFRFTNSEKDIVEKIRGLLPAETKLGTLKNYKNSHTVVNKKRKKKKSPFWQSLNKMGLHDCLSYQKFIPDKYLYNTKENRTALLRGLIDSDGHVVKNMNRHNNHIEYSTTSEKLKNNILELARSLGGRGTYSKKKGAYRKDGKRVPCRDYYRITMSFAPGFIPFSSKKHAERFGAGKKYHKKYILKIEHVGDFEAKCITVSSSDGLYITDGYILTHNSSFMMNISRHFGLNEIPHAIFSLEMSKDQLMERQISSKAGINLHTLRTGHFKQSDWMKITEAAGALHSIPAYIDDQGALHYSQVCRRARKLKESHDIQAIIIDYLQIMESDRNLNRDREIARITGSMKALAKELHIPVILLSQLNRNLEQRSHPHKRPRIADLRDSGNIENDADIIIFIYRHEQYLEDSEKENSPDIGIAEFNIAKHRNGATGVVRLRWKGETTSFHNLDTRYE